MKDTRRYLIKYSSFPNEIVEVPADWKVTFGPLVPGSQQYNNREGWTLRFYEAKDKQRMVLTNVLAFRCLDDVKIKRRVTEDRVKRILSKGMISDDQLPKVGEWEEVSDDEQQETVKEDLEAIEF